jgi:hypothetical protein
MMPRARRKPVLPDLKAKASEFLPERPPDGLFARGLLIGSALGTATWAVIFFLLWKFFR